MYYYSWLSKIVIYPKIIIFVLYSIISYIQLYNKNFIIFPVYKKVIKNLLLNFLISTLIGILSLKLLPTHLPLPNMEQSYLLIIGKLLFSYIISQLYFYFSHRLFHSKFLFTKFHYIHHEAINVNSLITTYCHPVEFIFSNLLSVILGPMLSQMSWKLSYIWYIFITLHSMIDHTEIKFISEHHNKHHKKINYNYSSWKFIDKLFGTYKD